MNNKEYLEKILPHKRPMILIDDVLEYSNDEKWIKTVVTISKDSIFYDKTIKGISSIVGIEYMAQTIGCYVHLRKQQNEPKIGFLLGTRLYNNKQEKFNLGETYTIKAEEVFYNDDIASFSCTIYDKDNDEIASATINAYQGEEVEKELING
ncbi:3-hydroxylacyl-ACP dehydratase [bacterium]|nr:3-hydroxylacyl-ACP dehydratase [bacterium]